MEGIENESLPVDKQLFSHSAENMDMGFIWGVPGLLGKSGMLHALLVLIRTMISSVILAYQLELFRW